MRKESIGFQPYSIILNQHPKFRWREGYLNVEVLCVSVLTCVAQSFARDPQSIVVSNRAQRRRFAVGLDCDLAMMFSKRPLAIA